MSTSGCVSHKQFDVKRPGILAFAVQLNKPLDVQVRSAKEVRAVITWEPAARDEKADSHSAENPTDESTQIVGFAKQAMVMLARSAIRAERHFQGARRRQRRHFYRNALFRDRSQAFLEFSPILTLSCRHPKQFYLSCETKTI